MYILGGSPYGAKKATKKVCFAAGTASGSAESAADGEASTSKEEDETDGDETDKEEEEEGDREEPIRPHEEGEKEMGDDKVKESESNLERGDGCSTTTAQAKKTETGADSVMDVDEGDPTVAYELETDEDATDTEEGGDKNVEKGAAAAEPTVPYNLKEEDESEDSDRTNVGETEKSVEKKEGSESVAEVSELGNKSNDRTINKEEGAAESRAEDHNNEAESERDTEKVESSKTEAESQEVKEKRELYM